MAPVAWWPCDDLIGATLQLLPDAAGGNDGYVNPHWCDPGSPHHVPGADVLFDFGTSGNAHVGDADVVDLGDNVVVTS